MQDRIYSRCIECVEQGECEQFSWNLIIFTYRTLSLLGFVFHLRLVYLWSMEWEVLSQTFGFDVEIKIVSDIFEEKCIYSITPGLYKD